MLPGRRADLAWLAVAVAVALTVVLAGIDGGELRTDDEGLYGMLARTALAHDVWLYPVDVDGSWFEKFDKPPLSLWLVGASFSLFGPSPTALRLPFALAYAIMAIACFAWGRRIGGTAMGAAWALGLATCGAALRWGRVACIEPLFLAPCVLALVAHADSFEGRRRVRAALLAGIALAVAVMVKQLAVAIAIVPVVGVELARREGTPVTARRLAIVLGMPLLVGLVWLLAARAAVGDALFARYVGDGIVGRLSGYATGHNLRQLNEIANTLDDVCAPLWWPLGVVGVAAWACRDLVDRRASGERPGAGWALPGLLVTAALVYDVVSSTLLPWYVLGLVVPLFGGAAWLVARFVAVAPRLLDADAPRPDAIDLAAAAAGGIVLATTAVAALQPLVSRVVAMLVVGMVAAVVSVAASRRPVAPWVPRALALAPVVALAAVLAGRARSRELHEQPGRFAALMSELAAREVESVAWDKDTRLDPKLAVTLFGVGAHKVTRPPSGGKTDAYVTIAVVPEEVEPPAGVELVRTAGAVAWIGDLSVPRWNRQMLIGLLDAGGLTWEAEHLFGERWDTLAEDGDASGGALRREQPWRNQRVDSSPLTMGPWLDLPRGAYTATFRLRPSCGGYDREVGRVEVTVGDKTVERLLECVDADGEWIEKAVPFTVGDDTAVSVRVIHEFGALAHDWTRISRR